LERREPVRIQPALTPAFHRRRRLLRGIAIEYLTGKRLGKRSCLWFTFEIDPANICARNLPETDGLGFHMIEPSPHLAQLVSQIPGIDSYFDNVKH